MVLNQLKVGSLGLVMVHGPSKSPSCLLQVRPQPLTTLTAALVDHLYPSAEAAGDDEKADLSGLLSAVKKEKATVTEAAAEAPGLDSEKPVVDGEGAEPHQILNIEEAPKSISEKKKEAEVEAEAADKPEAEDRR